LLHHIALSLLTKGYLSPAVRLKMNVFSDRSGYHSPPDFQGRQVNPPMILSDYVRTIVRVLVMSSHLS